MEDPHSTLWSQLALVSAVSASHMSMPNHWLPYVLVARAHGWSLRSTLALSFCGAFGHVMVTVLIVILLSKIGGSLVSGEQYYLAATGVLLIWGLYYLYTYFVVRRRKSCCEPGLSESKENSTSQFPHLSSRNLTSANSLPSGSHVDTPVLRRSAALSVILLTTLSPCLGSMPVLLAILAPPLSLTTIALASLVLLASAAAVMMMLVALSYLGAATLSVARYRKHERLVLGFSLVFLALFTYFGLASHKHHNHHPPSIHMQSMQGHAAAAHTHKQSA